MAWKIKLKFVYILFGKDQVDVSLIGISTIKVQALYL